MAAMLNLGKKLAAGPDESLVNRNVLCYGSVDVNNVRLGAKIRDVRNSGIAYIKSRIREGWAPNSFLHVVEEPVTGVTPLADVVAAHETGSTPEGYEFGSFLNTRFLAVSAQPDGVAEKRRFSLQDGAHRLTAVKELIEEYRKVGDPASLEAAERLAVLPAIIFKPCTEEEMVMVASVVNHSNTQFIETTYLDRYVLIRRVYALWVEKVMKRQEELADAGKKITPADKVSNSNFISHQEAACAKSGVSIKDIYGCSKKDMAVQVGLANAFHEETMAKMKQLFEQDVSITHQLSFVDITYPLYKVTIFEKVSGGQKVVEKSVSRNAINLGHSVFFGKSV